MPGVRILAFRLLLGGYTLFERLRSRWLDRGSGLRPADRLLSARDPFLRIWDDLWAGVPAACPDGRAAAEGPARYRDVRVVIVGGSAEAEAGRRSAEALHRQRLPPGFRLHLGRPQDPGGAGAGEPGPNARPDAATGRPPPEPEVIVFLRAGLEPAEPAALARVLEFFEASAAGLPDPGAGLGDPSPAAWRLGAVGATVLDDRGRVRHLFTLPGLGLVAGFPLRGRRIDPRHPWFRQARAVPAVGGGALAIDAAVFAQLGGFDPELPDAATRDADLCLRAQRAGFRNAVLPFVCFQDSARAAEAPEDLDGVRLFLRKWPRRLLGRPGAGYPSLSRCSEVPTYRWRHDFPVWLALWARGAPEAPSPLRGALRRVARAWRGREAVARRESGSGTAPGSVGVGGRAVPVADVLPSVAAGAADGGPSVVVFIPVYRDVALTRRCLDSVLASALPGGTRVLVLNDASPDPGMGALLAGYRSDPRVTVVDEGGNRGFVVRANQAFTWAGRDDVVLLNSDTEVAGDWLTRMRAHARGDRVATVTATSNHATICSFPTLREAAGWPGGLDTSLVQSVAGVHNAGRSVELPTAHGFCMYLTGAARADVGGLDEAAFGRGYGEENDFSRRASRRGWRHLQALDVWVHHVGETSFGDTHREGKAAAARVLAARHPDYQDLVGRHVAEDPARGYRLGAALRLLAAAGRPVELVMTHSWGGGVERVTREFIARESARAELLLLKPEPGDTGRLVSVDPRWGIDAVFSAADAGGALRELLLLAGVRRIHVQHAIGGDPRLLAALRGLGVPLELYLHDFWVACPFVNLTDAAGTYCGEPDEAGCDACIRRRPTEHAAALRWAPAPPALPAPDSPIRDWRARFAGLLAEAGRVVVPCADTAHRLRRLLGSGPPGRFEVRPYDDLAVWRSAPAVPARRPDEPLRVVVIGHLQPHKGRTAVLEADRAVRARRLPVELFVVGFFNPPATGPGPAVTGPYDDREVGALIASARPHVIWFPMGFPETYSYTLSEALRSQRPIIAPAIGAFTERLEGRPLTWLLPPPASVEAVLELWVRLAAEWSRTPSAAGDGAAVPRPA